MALTNYVLMPGADYKGICDAVRAKTGKTDPIKSGELASDIAGITGGGGSMEGVHTVTFMSEYGSTVLYERYVADGDDCANVVDRGLLNTPTKESTAQYAYTYSGWSLTSGGLASASALKSVTADRTVYAAFTSAVRYYTITYLDSDGSVLKTESLPYGATLNYIPEKEGFSFNGWSPALATVTGDASYSAQWLEAITFAGGSWADIAEISERGEAAQYFKVGDERIEVIGDKTVTLVIIGFNHDDLADGTGKAGITIWCKTSMGTGNKTLVYTHPWISSAFHTQYEEPIFDSFGESLQSVVKSVNKKYYPSNYPTSTPQSGVAKIWSLTCAEIGVSGYDDGQVYEKFSANINKLEGSSKIYDDLKLGRSFWLRTPNSRGAATYVNSGGYVYWVTAATTSYNICPCFCI